MSIRKQRGQALILIALAFVGLAAFIGLAVDAGILFIQYGHLRRAVDAASLSAANQFREGWTPAEMTAAGLQVLALNGLDPTSIGVAVETCDTATIPGDPALCMTAPATPRKLVRVTGTVTAHFAFLPIIGIYSAPLSANAISEAASTDIVLVIDSSESMAFDAGCDDAATDGNKDDDAWAETNLLPGATLADPPIYCPGCGAPDGVADDGCGGATPPMAGLFPDNYMRDPVHCNAEKQCRPFRDVQDAATALTTRLLPPYDRMAIVTFDLNAVVQKNLNYQAAAGLSNADYLTALNGQIMALDVYNSPGCQGWIDADDPTGCTSTNTAGGLLQAGGQFGAFKREEAVWIVILLSDGGANAAQDESTPPNWICPGSPGAANWIQPFCRDPIASTRHTSADSDYDPDDAARDRADWVGCLDSNTPASEQHGGCAALAPNYGQGAVIFTIGLGDRLTEDDNCDWGASCEPDVGEQMLRYFAAVGDDGDPTTDPCKPPSPAPEAPVGTDCGNYYFSPHGSDLLEVFEAIASRIFTRITH
ncbi:MAG: pilus assembly protein TadG-related protein [Chloroflexi bacterium]|nr:pilus assembly protein TadG-related protein [Chloroflexota bacterium]